jgi:hypothetical protein
MTQSPKEKADELIDKMYYIGRYDEKEDYNPAMAWERANHYPADRWDDFKVPETSKALFPFDGHTSHAVLKILQKEIAQ